MVTGRLPFEGRAPVQVLWKHMSQAPCPPSQIADGVPPELEALILRLMAKRPQDRLGYAEDVASALAEVGAEVRAELEAPAARPYLYRPGLAGREAPMGSLLGCLEAAPDGRANIVFLAAESGVGKTRLLVQLTKEAGARSLLVLLGEPSWGGTLGAGHAGSAGPLQSMRRPLQAVADWCRERGQMDAELVVGARGPILGPYVPELRQIPGQGTHADPPVLPPEAARRRVVQAVEDTLVRLSRYHPILLALDDLQWSDELTLELLRHLLDSEAFQRARILVVAAYRTEEAGKELRRLARHARATQLTLDRLDEQAVGRMVRDMLALAEPPVELVRVVARCSEGNPLFAAEYLRMAVEERLLFRGESGRWQARDAGPLEASLPMPGSVQELVRRRLAGLGPLARRVLETAAVLGREMRDERLGRAAGADEDEIMLALEELQGRQILEEVRPDGIRFTHDKLREGTYAAIEPERRRRLHLRAAEVLAEEISSQPEHLAALGEHWEQAGVVDRAAACTLEAARKSAARFALAEAERLYRKALELLARGSPASVQARNELAREVLWTLGRNAEAVAEHEAALVEAREIEDVLGQGTSLRGLCTTLRVTGRLGEALKSGQEALRVARAVGEPRLEGASLTALGAAHLARGDLGDARRRFDEALQIHRGLNDELMEGILLSNIGAIERERGHVPAALDLQNQALELHRRLRNRRSEGITLQHIGLLQQDLDDADQAASKFEQAVRVLREVGDGPSGAEARVAWAGLCLERGDGKAARGLLDEALEAFDKAEDRAGRADAWVSLARALRRNGGSLAEAERLLADADRELQQMDSRLKRAYCTCEQGHLELAYGRSAREAMARVQALAAETQVGLDGPLGRNLARLHRAQQAFETGRATRRGEPPEDGA